MIECPAFTWGNRAFKFFTSTKNMQQSMCVFEICSVLKDVQILMF